MREIVLSEVARLLLWHLKQGHRVELEEMKVINMWRYRAVGYTSWKLITLQEMSDVRVAIHTYIETIAEDGSNPKGIPSRAT